MNEAKDRYHDAAKVVLRVLETPIKGKPSIAVYERGAATQLMTDAFREVVALECGIPDPAAAIGEMKHKAMQRDGALAELNEAKRVLEECLGYPIIDTLPTSGEHTTVTLADEVSERIDALRESLTGILGWFDEGRGGETPEVVELFKRASAALARFAPQNKGTTND